MQHMINIITVLQKSRTFSKCRRKIPHVSKILLKILVHRLESKAESFVGWDQYGFIRGCGTRDAIAVMWVSCERNLEYNNKVYVCFVDYEIAFDRIDRVKLLDILDNMGVDWRDWRLIWNLYIGQSAYMQINDGFSEACQTDSGVRQGCCFTVKNSSITTKTFIPYFGVSISSRDLHQKKLVLSSSESWCDDQLSHQESGRRRDSTDNCPRLDS